jgi:membrane-bound serine protease (ClpP class)
LVLIAIEIFVLPGFGLAGILGAIALCGGLFLAMLGREIQTPEGIEQAAFTVTASLLLIIVGSIAVVALLPRKHRVGGMVLQSTLGGEAGPPAQGPSGWLRWFGAHAQLPKALHSSSATGVGPLADQTRRGVPQRKEDHR